MTRNEVGPNAYIGDYSDRRPPRTWRRFFNEAIADNLVEPTMGRNVAKMLARPRYVTLRQDQTKNQFPKDSTIYALGNFKKDHATRLTVMSPGTIDINGGEGNVLRAVGNINVRDGHYNDIRSLSGSVDVTGGNNKARAPRANVVVNGCSNFVGDAQAVVLDGGQNQVLIPPEHKDKVLITSTGPTLKATGPNLNVSLLGGESNHNTIKADSLTLNGASLKGLDARAIEGNVRVIDSNRCVVDIPQGEVLITGDDHNVRAAKVRHWGHQSSIIGLESAESEGDTNTVISNRRARVKGISSSATVPVINIDGSSYDLPHAHAEGDDSTAFGAIVTVEKGATALDPKQASQTKVRQG